MADKSIKKRVVVAMSGGVDSSVTAALLKKKGYECIGVYMNFWSDPAYVKEKKGKSLPTNKCCSVESLVAARSVAHKLDMPFYTLNVRKFFKENIVQYFLDTYKKGKTPNPCVECNRKVKFGYLIDQMKKLKCDYIATGHYARIRKKQIKGKTVYELLQGIDENKDQSYFLYTLTQEKLKHVLFPVGHLEKPEVKKLAKKYGFTDFIPKSESQGVCFFPDRKYHDFLKRNLPKNSIRKGPIINVKGKELGEHNGLQYYTIGQRKGIEIGGPEGPYYVINYDYKKNALIVGKEKDLLKDKLSVSKLTFVEGDLKDGEYDFNAKIRYRNENNKITLNKKGNKGKVKFKKPTSGITPGQSIVFYKGKKVIGGGIID
jgi:tRNA-specific 2-thiouridylase